MTQKFAHLLNLLETHNTQVPPEDRTLFCGNLSEKCTEELLYELFLQIGPLEKVKIACDRNGKQLSYSFIIFKHQYSVGYALNVFKGISLFKNKLKLQVGDANKSSSAFNAAMPGSKFNQPNANMTQKYDNQPYKDNRILSDCRKGKNDYYYNNNSSHGQWNSSYQLDRNKKPNGNYKQSYKKQFYMNCQV